MKKILLLSLLLVFLPLTSNISRIGATQAVEYSMVQKGRKTVKVKEYKRKDGTKVKSHKRSKPSKRKK